MQNYLSYIAAIVMMILISACSDENPTDLSVERTADGSSSSFINETSSSEIVISSSSSTEISFSSWEPYTYGELIDKRDRHVYKTIKIGEQTWMAENLKYEDSLFTWTEAIDQNELLKINGGICKDLKRVDYYPCNNIPYIGAKGVCPEKWHIPTNKEQVDLIQYANKSPEKFDTIVHYWLFGGVEKIISDDISSQFFPLPKKRLNLKFSVNQQKCLYVASKIKTPQSLS